MSSVQWNSLSVLIHKFTALFTSDPIQSGIALSFVGIFFSATKSLFNLAWDGLSKKLITSVAIPSKDETFHCVHQWLNEHEYTKNCSQLSVETTYDAQDDDREPQLLFTPSIGDHWINYKGKWIWLNKSQDSVVDIGQGSKPETITLSAFITNRGIFQDLIREAVLLSQRKERGKLIVHTCSHGSWRKIGNPEIPRPLKSIILKKGVMEQIISEIEVFQKGAGWHRSLGIPYRKGFMLHGPPGCGKTSLIKGLAGHFCLSVCLLNLNNNQLDDDTLNILMNETPTRSIIVIEDIDVAMRKTEGRDNLTNSGITLSGLLNALDGVASQQGRLLFMTTNKKVELDPALTRPGRIDTHIYFGLAEKSQAQQLFSNFFPDASIEEAQQFAEMFPAATYSMAELQKYFMNFRDNPKGALSGIKNIEQTLSDLNCAP